VFERHQQFAEQVTAAAENIPYPSIVNQRENDILNQCESKLLNRLKRLRGQIEAILGRANRVKLGDYSAKP
jgi:hypothetical protein